MVSTQCIIASLSNVIHDIMLYDLNSGVGISTSAYGEHHRWHGVTSMLTIWCYHLPHQHHISL